MTDPTLHTIAATAGLGLIPAIRRRAAEAVEWEIAISRLAFAFNLPFDEVRERFKQRICRSLLPWCELVSDILLTGEL